MAEISEQHGTLDDQPTFWLQAPPARAAPVVYVHGVPTSSEDWRPFLARTGGLAPDLPGFGRAGKRGDLPCTMEFYGTWLERFLDQQGIDRFSLVVHDWGVVGLVAAQRLAARVDRVVVINAAPLLPGYRWHWLARAWRAPLLGEAMMGATFDFTWRLLLRPAFARKVPQRLVDDIVRFFDGGTQRSILKLYRASPPSALAEAGANLGALTGPALVVWGDRDPAIPARFADGYGAALGGEAEVVHLHDAGHWPWHDRPDVVDRVAEFLSGSGAAVLRRTPPWVLSAVLALAYLLIDPPSADLAAQEYRAELFDREGLVLWDNAWYSGHHMPGYSVLFPPLAGWLGPRLVGALSAVAAAWLFERLAAEHFGDGARVGSWWFAAATAVNLVTGRLTFALGCALGLAALLAATHRRSWAAAALAALTTLASPVAGLFAGLAGAAWFLAGPRRAAAMGFGLAAVVPALVLTVAFPEGGVEPFVASAFWPALLALAWILFALPDDEGVLRAGVVLYALAVIASFALATPMGGNVTRLGAVFAGPVLACLLWRRHPRALALLALPLLYWQWNAPVRDWTRAGGDPSVEAGYYTGVRAYLRERQRREGPLRVEVPFTRVHWEARWVALDVALARGWQRQLDVGRNEVFYEGELTPARYTAWLHENSVSYVAVPDAALDHSAVAERRLIDAGRVRALRAVWRDAHWRVYAVRAARPLARGGRLTAMGTDRFTVRLPSGGGEARVNIRWSRWWTVTSGRAALRRSADDRTLVRGAGDVTVKARLG